MKNMNIFALTTALFILTASQARTEDRSAALGGRISGTGFAQLAAQAKDLPGAATGASGTAIIPARVSPAFTVDQLADMNKAINRLSGYSVKVLKNPRLKANLDCLLEQGTPEQKAALVYAPGAAAYKFPEACSRTTDKGALDGIGTALHWICENVIVPVCKNVCTIINGAPVCEDQCTDKVVQNCGWQ